MPNICDNYATVQASEATINKLMAASFDMRNLYPPPNDISGKELFEWLYTTYSTRWISNEARDGSPEPERLSPTSLKVRFLSAWNVPFNFLKRLTADHPDIVLNYEYHVWESGFIGYGRMTAEDQSDPEHLSYDTLEELRTFVSARPDAWTVCTGNPQLEYAAGDMTNFSAPE
jgi:hypothetical protein